MHIHARLAALSLVLGGGADSTSRADDQQTECLNLSSCIGQTLVISGDSRAANAKPTDRARTDESAPVDISPEALPKLDTRSPEAGPWPTTPWPDLSPQDRPAAILALRASITDVLADAGITLPIVETAHFLVATDLGRDALAEWLADLDPAGERMASMLELPAGQPNFPGKAAVLVFGDRDRFRLIAAGAFNRMIPGDVHTLFEARGSESFVLAHIESEESDPLEHILPGIARAILHHHISPIRPPLWANEGLADILVDVAARPGTPTARQARAHGISLLRRHAPADVRRIFILGYEDEPWPVRSTPARSIGALTVRLMMHDRHHHFLAWLEAIKNGVPWVEALQTTFRTDPDTLIDTVHQYYRVND